jgi:hypothetical protein
VNLSTVTAGTVLSIKANASDALGIAQVEFYVKPKSSTSAAPLICNDTTSTYSCNYTLPAGAGITYVIEAKAKDKSGNYSAASAAVVEVTSQ